MEEGLTIRTMNDDISEFRGQKPVLSASNPKNIRPVPKRHSIIRRIAGVAITVFIIGVLGGGGWYAYRQIGAARMIPVLSTGEKVLGDVIPKNATIIAEYNASGDNEKSIIRSLWGSSADGAGNPIPLLDIAGVSRIYYFALPGDSAPFFVVKKDENSTKFIAQLTGVQFGDEGGWYVVHAASLDRYQAELANGPIQGTDVASMIGQDGYTARFFIQSNSLDALFGLPVRLPSNRQQMVFDVTNASQDGALHAQYTISPHAVPEKLHPNVIDLENLIPADATFLRLGENFSNDITIWQQKYSILDATQYNSPAIQQFIAKLNAPYGFYTRIGADGVPDVGLVIQLPDALKKKISYSEPIVEQLLSLFAPLITGRPLTDQIVFADSSYASIPIRYANLAGKTASLDYTVGDNFILISSSKEGMSVLADRALSQGSSMMSQSPWSELVSKDALAAPYNMVIGLIKDPGILSVIPHAISGNESSASVLVSTKGDNTGVKTQATVLFAQ